MRILLVEDDPIIAASAEIMLTTAGYEVSGPALTVEEAIELAQAEAPTLALVDINLDGNDEGIALVRQLAADFGTKSIFVSGQIAVARANRDAAIGVLKKPYDRNALLMSVAVAERLLAGGVPPPPVLPAGLELFVQ